MAEEALKQLPDARTRRAIADVIDRLKDEPAKRGNPLFGTLTGYRGCRAAGQRYRVIYKVDEDSATVLVALIGIRKEGDKRDVYALAERLIRLGLLGR